MLHLITISRKPVHSLQTHWREGTWVGDNEVAGQMLTYNPVQCDCDQLPLEWYWDKKTPQDHFLIVRAGGIGDIITLTALARHLKGKFNCKITLATNLMFHQPCLNQKVFDYLIPYPFHANQMQSFKGKIIGLQLLVEHTMVGRSMPMIDVFAGNWDLILDNKKPVWDVSDSAKTYANCFIKREGMKRIGLQWRASSETRSYIKLKQVMDESPKDWQWVIFGRAGDCVLPSSDRIVNTCGAYSFDYMAAIAQTCDVILSPDSAITHLCGALDIPCVALFGPFQGDHRCRYYPTVTVMQGKAPCAPCFHHERSHLPKYPIGGECNTSDNHCCTAMASIKPKWIIEKLKEKLT